MADKCTEQVKRRYRVWPSARASQAVAKCRKKAGKVRKGQKGQSLRRWAKEKWKDTGTGKPCGSGGAAEYCRPSKVVSKSKTPNTRPSSSQRQENLFRKRAGQRAQNVKKPRR